MKKINDKLMPIATVVVIILISVSLYCIFKYTVINKQETKLENGITAVFTTDNK